MADQDLITVAEFRTLTKSSASRTSSATVALASVATGDVVAVTGQGSTLNFTKAAATLASAREFADAAGLVSVLNNATYGVVNTFSTASGTNVTITASPVEFLIQAHNVAGTITVTTAEDAYLEFYITAASEAIADYCGRILVDTGDDITTYTEAASDDAKTFNLPTWPVAEISSINEDVDRDWDTDTLVDSDDYYLQEDSGIVRRDDGTWMETLGAIKVVWQGGHTSIPEKLKQACVAMVNFLISQASAPGLKRARSGLSEIEFSGGTTKGGMPPHIQSLLSNERRRLT